MASRLINAVVVPTDFSEGAHRALERALLLPLGPRAKVTLLHVLPDDIPGKLRRVAIDEAERSLEKETARAQTLALKHGLKLGELVCDVVEGSAPAQIMKRAHATEADLVVLGRHGRKPVIDLFIGTTAQRVARTSDVPILLVQTRPAAPYARPLISVDLEKHSSVVVSTALGLVGETPAALRLFTASQVPFEDFVGQTAEVRTSWRERFARDAARELRALAAKFKPRRFVPEVQSGDARSLILEQARECESDLVVLGTHGKKALERVLVGSVAEWVLTHARTDVLVIP